MQNDFLSDLKSIEEKISLVDPKKYGLTRNFKNGDVTKLSPYISRGVISTKQIFRNIMARGLSWEDCEKLIQELAWRDYWQLVWLDKDDSIETDLKNKQHPIDNLKMPEAIFKAETGINAVDGAIKELYKTGYMHNHMRMYVAAICCNIANSHWLMPAKWMYSCLLDGDIASNYLSWQWVAGAFSNKKYYANQENINKFFDSNQKDTFLDVPYEEFTSFQKPEALKGVVNFTLDTILPKASESLEINNVPTLIYNYYNLSPYWHIGENYQRILLLEPSHFKKYPVQKHCIDFALDLLQNINQAHLFVGEFDELLQFVSERNITFKEHPTNTHYKGVSEPREWMTSVTGYFPSFFAFWKRAKKELRKEWKN